MNILVTGGAGFIGSALIRYLVAERNESVVNLDYLTYAGNLETLDGVAEHPRYRFEQGDIADDSTVRRLFETHRPSAVVHLAAESHVDRSIDGPAPFIETNVKGTFVLLEAARAYYATLRGEARERFRFVHVSTDEVYGSLGHEGYFDESSAYDPNSPYSASKAASDHFARAWWTTYGLPTVVTNCSNNYGPYQFPEKLIPLMILKAIDREPLPVYGDGQQVRDWIHVDDHVRALARVMEAGRPGETYLIGSRNEQTNLALVQRICRLVDSLDPGPNPRAELITHVSDRPGHDVRYAIDNSKVVRDLNWSPSIGLEAGLEATVRWVLEHRDYYKRIGNGGYHGERLGVRTA